jgi:beta-glucanase (GH16 family)
VAPPGTVGFTLVDPTTPAGVQPVGQSSGWTLVMSDEFNTGTKPNTAMWADHLIEGDAFRCNDNSSELEWYSHNKAGLSISGGALSLIARHEDPRNPASVGYDPLCPATLPSGNAGSFTSGMIQSKPGFACTYGWWEARFRLPLVDGTWPAFWSIAADAQWPPEFDVLEQFGTSNQFTSSYHPEAGGTASGTNTDGGLGSFHVFGMQWNSSTLKYYLDGVNWQTAANYDGTALPQHIIFNLAVQSNSGAGYPCQMDIDYVRAWQPTAGFLTRPTITSVTPATGVPTGGTLQVAFGTVAGAASYRATACPVDAEASGAATRRSATGSASPLTITGLTNGAAYTVSVAAVNGSTYSIESALVPSI